MRDDEKAVGRVTYENFERGMERRHAELARRLLATAGLDRDAQTTTLIVAVVVLVLVFAFVLVGVSAFARSTTLATVVNAALPAVAGLGNFNIGGATAVFNHLERLAAQVADVVQLESVSKAAGHAGTARAERPRSFDAPGAPRGLRAGGGIPCESSRSERSP